MDRGDEYGAPDTIAYDLGSATHSGWGQSDSCRVMSGWGQPDIPSQPPQHARSGWNSGFASYSSVAPPRVEVDNYSGPIETWSNYVAITPQDWELFRQHQVVFSDGKNAGGMEPGWLWCEMCGKKAMCKDLMHSHIESIKHRRNFEWYVTDQDRVSVPPVALSATADAAVSSGLPRGYPPLSDEDKRQIAHHHCEVDGEGWIVCTLCNKKMMDMTFFPTHIASRKHVNNLEWVNASVPGGAVRAQSSNADLPPGITRREWDYYCTLCGATMNSRGIVDLHVDSVRHQRALSPAVEIPADVVPRQGVPLASLIHFGEETSPPSRPVRPVPARPDRPVPTRPARPAPVAVTIPARPVTRVPSPPRMAPPQTMVNWGAPARAVHDIPNLIDI